MEVLQVQLNTVSLITIVETVMWCDRMIYLKWRKPGGELFKVVVTLFLLRRLFNLFIMISDKVRSYGGKVEGVKKDKKTTLEEIETSLTLGRVGGKCVDRGEGRG